MNIPHIINQINFFLVFPAFKVDLLFCSGQLDQKINEHWCFIRELRLFRLKYSNFCHENPKYRWPKSIISIKRSLIAKNIQFHANRLMLMTHTFD